MPTKSLVEGALLTAFTVLLSYISAYLPLLGFFASLFLAVPIIVLVMRHGLRLGIMAAVASSLLAGILAQPYQALVVLFAAGLVGISMGGALEEKFSPVKTLAIGTAASTISSVGLMLASFVITGIDPIKMDMKLMTETMDQVISLYRGMGMKPEQLRALKESMKAAMDSLRLMIPGAIVIAGAFSTFLNYSMTRAVMSRVGQPIEPLPPFKLWMFSRAVTIGLAAGVVLTILKIAGPYGHWVRVVGTNLFYIFGSLCLVQGLAVGTFIGLKYRVSPLVWILLLFLVNPAIFLYVLGWFGVLDPLVDFRKIRKGPGPNDTGNIG